MQEKESEVIVLLIVSSLVVLILGTVIVATILISQKRKYRNLQNLADLKSSYEKEILNTQLEIQSQTFETISRELHDNVGTLISIAMVHINSVMFENKTGNQANIQEAHKLLDEAMVTLKDISRSINPENIGRLGLVKSIESELEKHRKTKLFTVRFTAEGDEFFIPPNRMIILFRIVQESLNNIVKHSLATLADIHLIFHDTFVKIIIQDNGKGFNYRSSNIEPLANGSGINNMKARASLIGAKLDISSHTGTGTIVTITYADTGNIIE